MTVRSYAQAVRDGHAELLANDSRVFVIGQGLWSPWYAGSSLQDLEIEFGRDRLIDSPVSENATTAAAIGAALTGMRPIVFHPRMDFMLLAVDPIINQAANWSYMFGAQVPVPVVIRCVINRGGQQGAQHSQALQAMFAHIPGLKVVMPATPADAKGLLISASQDPNPVMYIDDRWLYAEEGEVPDGMHRTPLGVAATLKPGKDVTIVASSHMTSQALTAATELSGRDIDAEVIDLRTVKPWDRQTVLASVERTGRLVVADSGWATCGVSADIAAVVADEAFHALRAPIRRVTLPEAPAPVSEPLERAYYPDAQTIRAAVEKLLAD